MHVLSLVYSCLPGLPADTLQGHRDRFQEQFKKWVCQSLSSQNSCHVSHRLPLFYSFVISHSLKLFHSLRFSLSPGWRVCSIAPVTCSISRDWFRSHNFLRWDSCIPNRFLPNLSPKIHLVERNYVTHLHICLLSFLASGFSMGLHEDTTGCAIKKHISLQFAWLLKL